MSDVSPHLDSPKPDAGKSHQYVVVARRYRPQAFDELVGQEHIARALSNAITTSRVGHAYLFTGARGVGKTSTARILAKALNCTQGPTPSPCNQCDVCQGINSGDDVDVLEIDGASNRGIDEIRQLRQNVNVRPSRARFKIYIIDEVHMLTREAFNALLKTLEEPPEHVKFIFCTTEPTKIPITILSRCQRFDFAGILPNSIAGRLRQIVDAEGVSAEPEALAVLARRAAGSMRDGQSLLEQLLSFAPERITVADVHGMLGTAGEERLATLVGHLAGHDPAGALAELGQAVHEGVDPALLLEQLFGYFRDCLVAVAGCPAETFLYAAPGTQEQVLKIGRQFGLQNLMAAMQILDQAMSRLRLSTQGRILAELALVRICHLEDLEDLSAMIGQLRGMGGVERPAPESGGAPSTYRNPPSMPPTSAVAKKKEGLTSPEPEPSLTVPEESRPATALTADNAAALWSQALAGLTGFAVEYARHFDRVAISAPNHLVIYFRPGYTLAKSVCERPEQLAKFEQAMAAVTGQTVRIEFREREPELEKSQAATPTRAVLPHQRMAQAAQHPMVRLAGELFGAHPVRVDDPPATTGERNESPGKSDAALNE